MAVASEAQAGEPPAEVFVRPDKLRPVYHADYIDLNKNGEKDPYEDPHQPVEARIADLLGRMTLEEKTAQMATLYGYARVLQDELPTEKWKSRVWVDGIGNIDEHANGNEGEEHSLSDPVHDYPWSLHTRAINEVQRWFIEQTRLGIPVDFTNEGIRGLLHTRATSFPSQLGVAASWDKHLVREIGRVTGREARALGYTNIYSPILDLARDPRWGRTVETYGEDPFLVSELGLQQVLGIQEQRVVSTLKHFGVYSIPKGGRDGDARTDPQATWSEVMTVFLAPFRRAIIDGGALGVMASYNDYDGVPVEASSLFLTDLLRRRFGFRGYVVSDSGAVEFIHTKHRVAPTPREAIAQAVEAGLNVRTNFTFPEEFVEPLRALVRGGRLSMRTINNRVRDILRVKFWLGLFDQPYHVAPDLAEKLVRSPAHQKIAERANREAIVLLKNKDGVLPLPPTLRRILVTGPLANNPGAWWSRYAPQHLKFVTPLNGLRARFPKVELRYEKGVDATDKNFPESDIYREKMPDEVAASISAAVLAARDVDAVIAVVGEPGEISRESSSRISLNLPGYQDELLRALHTTGAPLIVILSSGRPMSANFAAKHADGVLSVGYLGEAGGTAIAEVLAGDYSPAGRLPITMPRSVGQVPYNFPFKPGSQSRDGGQVEGPLYPFGHGLSYCRFRYENLKVEPQQAKIGQAVRIAVDVINESSRDGEEVVQLYLRDEYSSITTFERSLRGFERVAIAAKERKRVEFELRPEHLELFGVDRRWKTEPGRFTVMVGASSADLRLTKEFEVVGPDGRVPPEAARPLPPISP